MACRKTATRYFTVGPETGYPLSPFYLLIYFSLKYGEAGQDCFVVNLPQSNAPVQNKKNIIIIKTIPIILGSWRGWPSHSRPPVLSRLPFPCSAQVQRSLVSAKCLVEYNNPPRARTRTTRNHEPPHQGHSSPSALCQPASKDIGGLTAAVSVTGSNATTIGSFTSAAHS